MEVLTGMEVMLVWSVPQVDTLVVGDLILERGKEHELVVKATRAYIRCREEEAEEAKELVLQATVRVGVRVRVKVGVRVSTGIVCVGL